MIYTVTFDTRTQYDGSVRHYVFHCVASNAREAAQHARSSWAKVLKENANVPPALNLHAHRSRRQNPDMLRVISWRGDVFNGRECFDILCTGSTAALR